MAIPGGAIRDPLTSLHVFKTYRPPVVGLEDPQTPELITANDRNGLRGQATQLGSRPVNATILSKVDAEVRT
jgi:hypothetical protein